MCSLLISKVLFSRGGRMTRILLFNNLCLYHKIDKIQSCLMLSLFSWMLLINLPSWDSHYLNYKLRESYVM